MSKKNTLAFCLFCALLLLLLFPNDSHAGNKETVLSSQKYDLDGDGKKDKIILTFYPNEANFGQYIRYELTVNHSTVSRKVDVSEFLENALVVVDLDRSDGQKEIAISRSGDDEVANTTFFSYDGKKLKEVGELPGFTKEARSTDIEDKGGADVIHFYGDGRVRSTIRSDTLLTWPLKQEYIYLHGAFYPVQQEVYDAYKPHKVKVLQPFAVSAERWYQTTKRILKKGEEITLLGTDNAFWIKCIDTKGNIFWLRLKGDEIGSADEIMDAKTWKDLGCADAYLEPLPTYA